MEDCKLQIPRCCPGQTIIQGERRLERMGALVFFGLARRRTCATSP
jgi:hypothetical protein